jgi:stage V sporulation protein B
MDTLSRGQSFIKGALILTIAGLSVKFIGAGLRIFLAAVMGDEGIGLYQMAYPIYTTLLAVSTAGIPIAVSKLVAENLAHNDYRGAYRVFKAALTILTLMGAGFSLLLYFGADFFVRTIVKDPRAYYPLVSISPAIFIVTIMSAFRGFFQGQQEMTPTAISQVLEQIGRVAAVIILVYLLIPFGLEYAAAGAAFGAVVGAVLSLAVLLFIFFRSRKKFTRLMEKQIILRDFSSLQIVYRIAALSIPITLGSLVIPLINLLDLSIVPLRLSEAGYSVIEATALYGQLTGMANSLVQFPIILTMALSMSLVPAISEAKALNNQTLIRNRTDLALRITLFVSIPSAFGLLVLAKPITSVLFHNTEAAYPLSILSFSVIFLSLYTASSGILQGLGHTIEPVINMFLGAVLKFIVSWFLTARPDLNVGGAALSTVLGFMLASILNLHKVGLLAGWRLKSMDHLLKPFIAALLMAWSVYVAYGRAFNYSIIFFSERLAQLAALSLAILVGVFVFFAVLLLLGGLRESDLRIIPGLGPFLIKITRGFKLIRKG